jgi:hypothetical protein
MNETSPTAARRHDLDWLRVFACYLLLLFHVAMVFNPAPFYHIRNADLSFAMLVLCGFIGLWHMPLFFVLGLSHPSKRAEAAVFWESACASSQSRWWPVA